MRSDDDARQDFGHLFGVIFDEVTEGVRDYYRDHPLVNHKHTVGTRRNIKRDYIVYRLRGALGGVSGIHVFNKNQTTNFGMNSRFLARVHKLGEELAAAVGHTQASMAFQRNEPTAAGLGEEFSEATCIRLGYVPLTAAPMDPRVFITCPRGRQNAWFIELRREAGTAIIPGSAPTPPADDFDNLVEVIRDPVRKGYEE